MTRYREAAGYLVVWSLPSSRRPKTSTIAELNAVLQILSSARTSNDAKGGSPLAVPARLLNLVIAS
jgi:hypothetical protein